MLSLTKYLNPYTYIGVAVVLASISGGFYYQSRQIHHYHSLYDADEKKIAVLTDRINQMTTAQNNQTVTSERTVTKVIQAPAVIKTLIKTVHDTPEPVDCTPPKYSPEVLNAF